MRKIRTHKRIESGVNYRPNRKAPIKRELSRHYLSTKNKYTGFAKFMIWPKNSYQNWWVSLIKIVVDPSLKSLKSKHAPAQQANRLIRLGLKNRKQATRERHTRSSLNLTINLTIVLTIGLKISLTIRASPAPIDCRSADSIYITSLNLLWKIADPIGSLLVAAAERLSHSLYIS
jgi:hypothetical protein